MQTKLKDINKIVANLNYPVPVVTPAHWANGLGVVRSLHQAGFKCIALNPDPRGLGINSRYAWGIVSPDAVNTGEYIQFMLSLGKQLPQKGVLLVTDDTALLALSAHRDELSEYFYFTFPEPAILLRVMDKVEQYKMAEQTGVPIPRTLVLDADSPFPGWPDNAYPVIIKGRAGKDFQRASRKQAIFAHNPSELQQFIKKYMQYGIILQEFIPGGDDCIHNGAIITDRTGNALAVFTGRKILQKPPTVGSSRIQESKNVPEIADYSLRMLRNFGYWGISQPEFKLDHRDGQYKLIEINCRYWLWNWLTTVCGVNFPVIDYRHAIGLPAEPIPSQSYGQRWALMIDEIIRIPNDIRKGQFNFSIFKQLRRPLIEGVFAWDDLKPAWSMLKIEISSLLSRFH